MVNIVCQNWIERDSQRQRIIRIHSKCLNKNLFKLKYTLSLIPIKILFVTSNMLILIALETSWSILENLFWVFPRHDQNKLNVDVKCHPMEKQVVKKVYVFIHLTCCISDLCDLWIFARVKIILKGKCFESFQNTNQPWQHG